MRSKKGTSIVSEESVKLFIGVAVVGLLIFLMASIISNFGFDSTEETAVSILDSISYSVREAVETGESDYSFTNPGDEVDYFILIFNDRFFMESLGIESISTGQRGVNETLVAGASGENKLCVCYSDNGEFNCDVCENFNYPFSEESNLVFSSKDKFDIVFKDKTIFLKPEISGEENNLSFENFDDYRRFTFSDFMSLLGEISGNKLRLVDNDGFESTASGSSSIKIREDLVGKIPICVFTENNNYFSGLEGNLGSVEVSSSGSCFKSSLAAGGSLFVTVESVLGNSIEFRRSANEDSVWKYSDFDDDVIICLNCGDCEECLA